MKEWKGSRMNLLTSREEFSRWWDHPGTEAFRTYLKDYRASLAEKWASGVATSPEDQVGAALMGQLMELSSDDIAGFYGVEREAE